MVGGVLEAELIQNEVGRRLLGANLKTATDVIRGELGWWSMKSRRALSKITFLWKDLSSKGGYDGEENLQTPKKT